MPGHFTVSRRPDGDDVDDGDDGDDGDDVDDGDDGGALQGRRGV